jgi:hypothetical protein
MTLSVTLGSGQVEHTGRPIMHFGSPPPSTADVDELAATDEPLGMYLP